MTARFLLDTDWVIDHFNGIAAITRRLDQLRPAGLALSVISLAELYEGVHYSRDPAQSRRVLLQFVAGVTVLPVDDEVCDIFGRERGRLRQQGRTERAYGMTSPSARTTVVTSRSSTACDSSTSHERTRRLRVH